MPDIPSDTEVRASRLPQRVIAKLFAHRSMLGAQVAVRPNLHGRVERPGRNFVVQTVHNRTVRGRALGYDAVVTVKDARFVVDEAARQKIADGAAKFPMAGVVGSLDDQHSFAGVEIRFDPRFDAGFVRDDGRIVLAADVVTVVDNVCYARGAITHRDP